MNTQSKIDPKTRGVALAVLALACARARSVPIGSAPRPHADKATPGPHLAPLEVASTIRTE